ncbi:hypothetical protein L3Y19_gp088 [Gordonia phage Neville]|uniref:Uncharacterized protein n=2 Tax=Nevillevirus TaxID=3044773 RepID=A0A515MH31_9CAUD|nr:hypothetical protein L3Y19_gp088 [Gordonia phage Neville]YP_010246076.1 hypothetical protein L3Y20_gp091 [Gordonia phage Trax]AXQ64495.1 hypothetical protein SEA_NEVILLE_88 [Gordonia phage Neville]QDM55978.1 hypothetical protein SEA_TRAX_91 [Gordonia phage Trax]
MDRNQRGFESRQSDGRRCVDCGYFTNWICRFKSCRQASQAAEP